MNFGIIPETVLERAAVRLGLIPVPIIDLLFGPLKSRMIMAGVTLGIFEGLRDRPRTVADLANSLQLDRGALDLLLRGLAHLRYLQQRETVYELSPLARRTLLADSPRSLTGYARWNEVQWRFLEQLETLIRTGKGVDFHGSLSNEESWKEYQQAMLESARFDAATLARLVPVPKGATRLLDLGGAHGLLGAAICRKHPPMRSTVVDLPQAVEHGRALASKAGHIDVVDFRAGDLRSDPLEDADIVLLSNILHHLKPCQVEAVLSRALAALRPRGTIAIWEIEASRPEARVDHRDIVSLFFQLTSTAQIYHGSEYAQRLRETGFRSIRVLRPGCAPGRVLVLAEAHSPREPLRSPETRQLK
jgi:hypothetical protein